MLISSDLIPHNQFHKGQWLRSRSQWYYFYQCERQYKLPTTEAFYQTIDEQLLPLVKYLHSKSIPTTPSCQGHFFTEDYYKELYRRLCIDAELINSSGLVMQNDDMDFTYINQQYKLPWIESEFLQQTQDYQTNGVLGFVDTYQQYYHALKDNQTDDIRILHDRPITIVQIRSANNSVMVDNWKAVYDMIEGI